MLVEFYTNAYDCFTVERMLAVLGYMSLLCVFGAFPFGFAADYLRSKFSGNFHVNIKLFFVCFSCQYMIVTFTDQKLTSDHSQLTK